MRSAWFLVCLLPLQGCVGELSFGAGQHTDGGTPDGDVPDADLDANVPDANLPDAGLPDADLPDAGLPPGKSETEYLQAKCPCVPTATGGFEAVCLAGGSLPPLLVSETACRQQVINGSGAAQTWQACRRAAFGAGVACMDAIDACDTAAWNACDAMVNTDLAQCGAVGVQAQLDACMEFDDEATIFENVEQSVDAECACSANPSTCKTDRLGPPEFDECKLAGLQDALTQSTDPGLAQSTASATRCRVPLSRRLHRCAQNVSACSAEAFAGCSQAYLEQMETLPACDFDPVLDLAFGLCTSVTACQQLGFPPGCEDARDVICESQGLAPGCDLN